MSMYVSDDLKATYGPALDHLNKKLSGYNAVAVMGDDEMDAIRDVLMAKGPEPQNSMMAKLIERVLPGQGKELIQDSQNLEGMKVMLNEMMGAWRASGPAAGGIRLMVGGKEVTIGMVYLTSDLKTTPQSEANPDLPGFAREDKDPALHQRQLRDTAAFIAAHEIGHLVDGRNRNRYAYDVLKNPPAARMNQADTNRAESIADRFAAAEIRLMAAAGIVSNGNIASEFMHCRAITGISEMLKGRPGVPPEIHHTTGIIDDEHRLQEAANQVSDLWHEWKRDKSDTVQNRYAFMQDLKKRSDIPPDVKHIANTYVASYDYMVQGRTGVKGMGAHQLAEAATSMQQNEPVIAHSEVDTKMLIKGQSVGEYFAAKAEGQGLQIAAQLAHEIPEAKISKRMENSISPA